MTGPGAVLRYGVLVLAALALLVGAGPTAGPPLAPPTPPTPPVTVARDADGLRGCAATASLAPDLVAARSAEPAGDGCSWTDPSGTSLLRADVRAAGGLDSLYRAAGEFRAFRPGELDGAPTVVTTPPGDPSCSLHAGVTDAVLLVVQVGPAAGAVPDPCAAAAAAAARLLDTMPRR